MKSQTNLEMCHVGSKTRSLGQKLEKPFVRSRGHIFRQIIMKLGQNFCLAEIPDQIFNLMLMIFGLDEVLYIFLNGSSLVKKNRSLGQIVEHPMLVTKGL